MPSQPSPDILLHASRIACVRARRTVVSLCDLSLAAGELVELRGANGSGKTTLLRALAGLFPFEGAVEILAPVAFVGHRNGNTGLLTAMENLVWHLQLQGLPVTPGTVLDALQRTGLLGTARQPVQQLSQGQQRRLALARLLLTRAPVWLLDEPHAALDRAGQRLLDGLLVAHCQAGGAVLVSSHTPLAVATRVIDLSPDVADGVAA